MLSAFGGSTIPKEGTPVGLHIGFERVLSEYLAASQDNFTQHALANFIRGSLRDTVALSAGENERLLFKGSAGQGNWARGPWVGIFDKLVTASAQSGYYPVYLFREDMTGLYVSLNQGMTEARKLYKSDAKSALKARAANFRAMLGKEITNFPEIDIDLRPSDPSNDTAFYEAGNICAKFYSRGHLPNEAQLVWDLTNMVQLYETLIQAETDTEVSSTTTEGDEPPDMAYEDATRFRMHKRIERNARLATAAKKHHGYICQVCDTNFEARYGEIGKEYIEAHHLRPLASLKEQKVAMDPAKDFAVLCANCHRMIHRSSCVDDIAQFKKEHYRGQPISNESD
jgi:5-methylcytosine-specific restriction enzyme A